jgi:hypothetical protein
MGDAELVFKKGDILNANSCAKGELMTREDLQDGSGNGVQGTRIYDPQFASTNVVGSHAIQLDRVEQYIDFGETGSSGGGAIMSWPWDFGEGQHDPSEVLKHAHVDGNTYDVTAVDRGSIGTHSEDIAALDMEEGEMIQVGYTTVFPGVSTGPSRRAEQVTMPSEGMIQSINIYHNGGSGGLLLAVYSDNAGTPGTRLGVTQVAALNSTEGWQELALIYPVSVIEGQKVWLAWLTETAVGLRYGYESPGRIDSGGPWSEGMPMVFGAGTSTGAVYSLYATVLEGAVQSTPNLMAHWELDNSLADASGNNIHGTINGSPQFVSSAIVGSHAIELNGADQYIDL